MSLLNLVWQGIGIMRNETTNFEQKLKNCNGLNAIRSLADKFPELKQEFLDSVEPSKRLMIEMVHRIHTSAGDVFSFDSDINYELGQLENELKKIQPDFKMDEMIQKKKVCLSDYPRIQNAIAEHCVLGHNMFSFKKCSLEECCIPHICSAKHLENDMFSTLHHLPFPMKKLGDEKFKHFDEVYGEITSEGNRPCLIEKEKSSHHMPFSLSSQSAKNTGTVVV